MEACPFAPPPPPLKSFVTGLLWAYCQLDSSPVSCCEGAVKLWSQFSYFVLVQQFCSSMTCWRIWQNINLIPVLGSNPPHRTMSLSASETELQFVNWLQEHGATFPKLSVRSCAGGRGVFATGQFVKGEGKSFLTSFVVADTEQLLASIPWIWFCTLVLLFHTPY